MAGLDIECPKCRTRFGVNRAGLAAGRVVPCPNCGYRIVFTAADLQTLLEFGKRVGRRRS